MACDTKEMAGTDGEDLGSGRPEKEPAPPQSKEPWRVTFQTAVIISAIFSILILLGFVTTDGLKALTHSGPWAAAGIFFVIIFGIGILFRQDEVTEDGIRKKERRRRRKRGNRPRDLAILGTASAEDRQDWYAAIHKELRWIIVWRFVLAIPLSLALPWLILDEFNKYAENGIHLPWVGLVLASLAFIGAWVLVISGLRALHGDPRFIVGRITGGLYGVVMQGGQGPSEKKLISNWLEYGSALTITIEGMVCVRLRSDGSLDGDAQGKGPHEFGARGRVKRRAIMNERCVVICAGPRAIYLLGDFVDRLRPASTQHEIR